MSHNNNDRKQMAVEDISKTLREERKRLGMTQVELALLARCSIPSVIAAEHGKATLRLDILIKLAEALGLEIHLTRGD